MLDYENEKVFALKIARGMDIGMVYPLMKSQ